MTGNVIFFRLVGMTILCLAAPPLLCHFVGPAVGAVGALGAAAFWYSQYRFPVRKQRSGPYFWFVAGGYGLIGVTLVVCLVRLMGGNL